jgi:hypothetical protein
MACYRQALVDGEVEPAGLKPEGDSLSTERTCITNPTINPPRFTLAHDSTTKQERAPFCMVQFRLGQLLLNLGCSYDISRKLLDL